MTKSNQNGEALSAFDRDFGRVFEPVEETVILDDVALKLLDRRPPGDPELAQEYRLLVVEPSGQEWEYPIRGEILIGRSEDNQITLEDRAVSRHHLAVNTDGQLYWFQDLESGNGTQLNGEFVHEGWLTGGEELIVGNSRIYFLVPEIEAPPEFDEFDRKLREAEEAKKQAAEAAAAAAAAEAAAAEAAANGDVAPPETTNADEEQQAAAGTSEENSGGGKWIVLALTVFVFALGITGIGAWWIIQKMSGNRGESTTKEDTSGDSALSALVEGKKLIAQRKWLEADRLLRRAASETPTTNPLQAQLLELVSRVGRELEAQTLYKRADSLYNKDDNPTEALQLLKRVSKESDVYDSAQALKRRILRKELTPKLEMAKVLLTANKKKKALELVKKILEMDDEHSEALALQARINGKRGTALPRTRPRAERRPPPRRRKEPKRRKPPKRKGPPINFSEGLLYYGGGQYSRAIVFFTRAMNRGNSRERRRARSYRSAVKRFQSNLSRGLSALRSGNNKAAASALRSAASADRILGSRQRSKYASALQQASKRQNQANAAQIKKLEAKAKKYYKEALVLKDVDNAEANRLLKKVMRMLPPSSSLYQRARRKLN